MKGERDLAPQKKNPGAATGTGRGPSPPRPLVAVRNVTAHPATASVPMTVFLCNSPLLCSFNVGVKGLRYVDVENGQKISRNSITTQIVMVRYCYYCCCWPGELTDWARVGSVPLYFAVSGDTGQCPGQLQKHMDVLRRYQSSHQD